MASVRIGTSGWQYDDWDGRFYPDEVAKRRWFEHYRTVFPTVEVNATFYRLPSESTVTRWHDQAPDRFRYAIKGSSYVTHALKLGAGTGEAVGNVVRRMAGLKSFHGVWLWQLPPNLHRDDDRLARFLDALPGGAGHAVEFRHESWFADGVLDLLEDQGVACVWLSDAQMPDVTRATADFVYVRFHGLSEDPDQRYRWDYSRVELEPWAARLREQVEAGRDVWAFFNNDHLAKAPANARLLAEMLDDVVEPW